MTALGNDLAPAAAGVRQPAHGRIGVLDPLRRKTGLALLCTAALIACANSGFYAAYYHTLNYNYAHVGNFLLAAPWFLLAVVAFCGTAWARSSTGARPGDSALLAIAGVVFSVEAVAFLVVALYVRFSWMPRRVVVRDATQLAVAVGALTLGVLALVLAGRYGRHRVGSSGHTPVAPLLIAGISFFGFLYGDLYFTSWFEATSLNTKVSGVLGGVAYGGIGIALGLSAILRLGPASRLAGTGLGFLAIGITEGIISSVSLRQNVYPGLYYIKAGGYLLIACILLTSALLAPSVSRAAARPGALTKWPHPEQGSPVPQPVGVPEPPAPVLAAWPPQVATDPGVASAPRFCAACGSALTPGSHFCTQCGRAI
jgi:hypothetical protein